MDCCASIYKTIPVFEALPSVVNSQGNRKLTATLGSSDSSRNYSLHTQNAVMFCGFEHSERFVRCKERRTRKFFVAGVSSESGNCEFTSMDTPFKLRSSSGTYLSTILQRCHHNFHSLVAAKLHALAADRNAAHARVKHSLGSAESCLHRRILELKEHECRIMVEDIMYVLIVERFSRINVPMIPRLSAYIRNDKIDIWKSKDRELESVHRFQVLEMLREHLVTIFGQRGKSAATDSWIRTPIHRLQLGRVYAVSIMFGYFMKSVHLRHQLESCLALTNKDVPFGEGIHDKLENLVVPDLAIDTQSTSWCEFSEELVEEHEKLKRYVQQFDPETLQRCSKLKSREAVNLVENHIWSLCVNEKKGDPGINGVVFATFSSLKRLVLEALAFGSFLWDVEEYVDTRYKLTENELD